MSWHSAARSLGNVIGVLAESRVPGDPEIATIILPVDRRALYGEEPGATFNRADGTTVTTEWARPSRDVRRFSDVEIIETDYDPLLTPEQLAVLDRELAFTLRTKAAFIPSKGMSASGKWVLHAFEGESREYYLVPMENSPAGDAE
jgi:hypothetical protein